MRRTSALGPALALLCGALGLLAGPARAAIDAPYASTPGVERAADRPRQEEPVPAAPGAAATARDTSTAQGAPAPGPEAAEDPDFPLPDGLRPAVGFWKRVYLEITTEAGFLHDSRYLGVVYETVRLSGTGERGRSSLVKMRKRHWRAVLERLRRGGTPRDDEEAHVVRLMELALGRPPTPRDYALAARRIRFQLGQRDKFRSGLIASGAYEDAMRAVFREKGLPEDLAYLPHVESSFNLSAYSKHGAAGVWQFMRTTGRRFLKIDYVVDERLDPMIATHAAARLLEQNYESLGVWPLAITAYNHGRSGMARAKRRLGTDRIDVIVEKYRSRRFGFASRNFYAQFLAARSILRSYESYFGPVRRDLPEAVDEITLPFFAGLKSLETRLGVAPEVIRHYNPSLRPPVYRGAKRIPKGFVLRLPAGTAAPDVETWLAGIPQPERHAKQVRSNYYQVRRGDTLSRIAKRNGTSVSALVVYNNLPSRHRIYPGQVLQIPVPGQRRPRPAPALVKTAHAAAPKPEPPPAKLEPAPATPPQISEDSPWRRVDGDWIMVDDNETPAHFAEWLEVSVARIRKLNGLSRARHLRFGQRLRLDFSRVSPAVFLVRRMEFHKGIEEDFFGTYRVSGTTAHRLKRGESLWELAHKRYSVPVWLIHRYNHEVDFNKLMPGTELRVPVIERIDG